MPYKIYGRINRMRKNPPLPHEIKINCPWVIIVLDNYFI
jgi:hypothetical protein